MCSKILYEAARETLVEYLNKTSLNGCSLLYFIRRRKYQRLVWFVFMVMTVTFATYVCTTVLSSFLGDPIVTTLDYQEYTVYEAPFPSVAVCSHNKFSRLALWHYASNITLNSGFNQTLTYWMTRLEMLSGLHNYDSIDFEETEKLHLELENSFGENFVTSKILKMLAPLCEDLLVKCFWNGQIIDCKKEFEFKMFLDGPCCVFNYQYMKNLDSVYYPDDTGSHTGLVLLLNTSSNDYFYAEDNTIGFNVKLFATQFIPDIKLGDMDEFHVGAAEDVHVQLRLISLVSSEDTRIYSVHKRLCYFPFEQGQFTFGKAECILKCQARTITQECQCVPFYMANSDIEYQSNDEIIDECSLLHLACLSYNKYELLDASECMECYPLCSYNLYSYRKTVNRLNDSLWLFINQRYLRSVNITPDISLVKIFYPNEIATKYNRDVLYNWTHMLSHIGGVIGICMGGSIINGIEMIYFAFYRLIENFLKLRRTQS